jgi:hypothetical protein
MHTNVGIQPLAQILNGVEGAGRLGVRGAMRSDHALVARETLRGAGLARYKVQDLRCRRLIPTASLRLFAPSARERLDKNAPTISDVG